MIIHPWNKFSKSARAIRQGLKSEGIRATMSWLRNPKKNEVILNWGDTSSDFLNEWPEVLNKPRVICLLTNKLRFFRHCVTGTVPWTTDKTTAAKWDQGYARQKLEGSSGEGIQVWHEGTSPDKLPDARLYTKRVFGVAEYRVHVGRRAGSMEFYILDTQRKVFQKSDTNPEPVSWAVRSHANGFVFVRNSPPPEHVLSFVLGFVARCFPDLHFVALDVIIDKKGQTFVLEGNTAPGLEGQTVDTYVNFFKEYCK